jgi:Domain of unknown function (DUF1906)
MTSPLEPGSREWYLAKPDSELAHSRSWYEADGAPRVGTPYGGQPVRRVMSALGALPLFPSRAPLGFMLDWSGARLSDAQLVLAVQTGARCASRYIAPPNPASDWKRITPPERDSILRRMDLWLNYEWYAGRCLEGAGAGDQDAQWANSALFAIGYPPGRVVPFSHDTGTINDPAVKAYYKAVRNRLDTRWGLTCYGSYHTVTMLVPGWCLAVAWQAKAWSGTSIAPSSIISNFQNTLQWFGGAVDENVIKAWPFGAWRSPYPPPVPVPVPPPVLTREDDMIMVQPDPLSYAPTVPANGPWPGVFLLAGNSVKHISHRPDVAAYTKAGVAGPVTITRDEFNHFQNVTKP